MEATMKIFVFLLLSCLCIAGNASDEKCKVSDLEINQGAVTGQVVGGRQLYGVTVFNRCVCTQMDVKVACHGFNSSMYVYPQGILSADGNGELCTFNGGRPIPRGLDYAITFYYASSTQISLKPVSSTLACLVSDAPAPAPSPF